MLKRLKIGIPLVLGFSDEDKLGTIQPHDDALVVTLRIDRYEVKKGDDPAKIMYHDLYEELNLKPESLTAYSSPLVSFECNMVILKG